MAPAPTSAAAHPDWLGAMADEPAFGLESYTPIRISTRWSPDSAGSFLARAIAREPANLRMHVQRIALWSHTGRHDETFGAIVDLFHVLGSRGTELRTRVRDAAAPNLALEQRAYLDRCLSGSTDVLATHPNACASVLSRGITGSLDGVHRVDDTPGLAPAPARLVSDVLAEAHDYLMEGNAEMARELLESGLRATPQRTDIAAELLSIYCHAGDARRLAAMRAELGARLTEPAAWDECRRAIGARIVPA